MSLEGPALDWLLTSLAFGALDADAALEPAGAVACLS